MELSTAASSLLKSIAVKTGGKRNKLVFERI